MRIGLQLTPERGQYAAKVDRLVADAQRAERDGFANIWFPQIPDEFEALTALALMGGATSRIELGSAVLPIQSRHPVAMAQQALSTQLVCGGRLRLGVGASHHWIVEDMLGLPYDKPVALMRDYLDVLLPALSAQGGVEVENDSFCVHQPLDISTTEVPLLMAALGPVMLRIAGERATGTILWLADEKAIGDFIAPTITKAAADAGRPAPRIVAQVPVTLVASASEVDAARRLAATRLGHAESSPNYQRLLEHGDAHDIDDVLVVGDEAEVLRRLQRFRDAGTTDFVARVLPIGDDDAQRAECHTRTQALLASLVDQLAD